MTDDLKAAPKPFVFVLMPFGKAFQDVYRYGIKKPCTEAGAYCERVDEQAFDGNVVDRIYNQIAKADVVIADMTGRNANVFYETGYAHALGKRTILLTQKEDDIPFDLRQFQHIVYSDISALEAALRPRVEWAITHPDRAPTDPFSALSFAVQGAALTSETVVDLTATPITGTPFDRAGHPVEIRFSLDIHNRLNRVFDAREIDIGLVVPAALASGATEPGSVRISEHQAMLLFTDIGRLLPSAWRPLAGRLQLPFRAFSHIDKTVTLEIRVFSELGQQRTPFTAKLGYRD